MSKPLLDQLDEILDSPLWRARWEDGQMMPADPMALREKLQAFRQELLEFRDSVAILLERNPNHDR